jgi:hypothetical protein
MLIKSLSVRARRLVVSLIISNPTIEPSSFRVKEMLDIFNHYSQKKHAGQQTMDEFRGVLNEVINCGLLRHSGKFMAGMRAIDIDKCHYNLSIDPMIITECNAFMEKMHLSEIENWLVLRQRYDDSNKENLDMF